MGYQSGTKVLGDETQAWSIPISAKSPLSPLGGISVSLSSSQVTGLAPGTISRRYSPRRPCSQTTARNNMPPPDFTACFTVSMTPPSHTPRRFLATWAAAALGWCPQMCLENLGHPSNPFHSHKRSVRTELGVISTIPHRRPESPRNEGALTR